MPTAEVGTRWRSNVSPDRRRHLRTPAGKEDRDKSACQEPHSALLGRAEDEATPVAGTVPPRWGPRIGGAPCKRGRRKTSQRLTAGTLDPAGARPPVTASRDAAAGGARPGAGSPETGADPGGSRSLNGLAAATPGPTRRRGRAEIGCAWRTARAARARRRRPRHRPSPRRCSRAVLRCAGLRARRFPRGSRPRTG